MIPLTAVLIIKNEEKYIERALNSLLWCDEIVVVDSGSTDKTIEICNQNHAPWAKLIQFRSHDWLGFSGQRNFAMQQARNDWVFFLDGDEQCSAELAVRIQSLLATPSDPELALYKIRRQEFFLQKPIHYSIWNPSYHIRLFNRKHVQFIKEVHEGVESKLPTLSIHEPIYHVPDLRIERFLDKLNHYTTLQAKDDYARGLRTNWFRIIFSFPAMFYKNYIYYRGYRDGYEGFIISTLEGISRTVRHLKIWQIERLTKN